VINNKTFFAEIHPVRLHPIRNYGTIRCFVSRTIESTFEIGSGRGLLARRLANKTLFAWISRRCTLFVYRFRGTKYTRVRPSVRTCSAPNMTTFVPCYCPVLMCFTCCARAIFKAIVMTAPDSDERSIINYVAVIIFYEYAFESYAVVDICYFIVSERSCARETADHKDRPRSFDNRRHTGIQVRICDRRIRKRQFEYESDTVARFCDPISSRSPVLVLKSRSIHKPID